MERKQGLGSQKPILIAGPCSAETEEQVLQTAREIQSLGVVDAMRLGIWKPRTRPGHFEGVGRIGLSWLQTAKRETGLAMAVEVASATQVEDALKAGVDIFWLGARTTTNPFSVQEIADALRGVSMPIYIKNPVNPDLQLWVGAFERIEKAAGKARIGLVHRGFSMYGPSEYRNAPTWQLAIEMKRLFSGYPFLIDPSHICGNRSALKGVVQKAIDLDYDGILIESHYRPDEAWSDAQQQITPRQLEQLLSEIVWRKGADESLEPNELLDRCRKHIDQLDDEILRLLGKRMDISREIGNLKKEKNWTILQTARWNETLVRLMEQAQTLSLSDEFIAHYFNAIHMESIKQQDQIMNRNNEDGNH